MTEFKKNDYVEVTSGPNKGHRGYVRSIDGGTTLVLSGPNDEIGMWFSTKTLVHVKGPYQKCISVTADPAYTDPIEDSFKAHNADKSPEAPGPIVMERVLKPGVYGRLDIRQATVGKDLLDIKLCGSYLWTIPHIEEAAHTLLQLAEYLRSKQ